MKTINKLLALVIFLPAVAFAQGGAMGGGGGSSVKTTENLTTLADYFYEVSFEPFYISDQLRAEVKDLQNIATIMGLSFDDDFWKCSILDEAACGNIRVDYRSVKTLPVEIIMKIKDVRGEVGSIQPFGYTPGDLIDSGTTKISATWLNEEIFNQLDLTDQAIALVHERVWAKFGLKINYNYLVWYTQSLRMLRDVEAGRRVYDQTVDKFLDQYSYHAFKMLTGTNNSDFAKFITKIIPQNTLKTTGDQK